MFNPKVVALLLTTLSISSCTTIDAEYDTTVYFIDNQSSYDLAFKVPGPYTVIPRGVITKFYELKAKGGGYEPRAAFDPELNNDQKTYLYKDSPNGLTAALLVSRNKDLLWIESKVDSDIFHYTLVVTDDMIN